MKHSYILPSLVYPISRLTMTDTRQVTLSKTPFQRIAVESFQLYITVESGVDNLNILL